MVAPTGPTASPCYDVITCSLALRHVDGNTIGRCRDPGRSSRSKGNAANVPSCYLGGCAVVRVEEATHPFPHEKGGRGIATHHAL